MSKSHTSHPRFAAYYERMNRLASVRRQFDPLRRELVGQAEGLVLEVGAGGGQNFTFYDPVRVTAVEAIEPDAAMRAFAEKRLAHAPVPIHLTSAPAESIPFPDAHFDSAVATLVFCSVTDPAGGLAEIRRVLKPGGSLFLLEHVRAQGKVAAWIQDALVPITTRVLGNCHWNRPTAQTVEETGFQITHMRKISGGLHPFLLIHAMRPGSTE